MEASTSMFRVAAQSTMDNSISRIGDMDGVQAVGLVIYFVFTLVFIILSILCAFALSVTRGSRFAYWTLLASLLSQVISSFVSFLPNVIQDGSNGGSLLHLYLLGGTLLGHWAVSLLFLSFCLFLKDKLSIISRRASAQDGASHESDDNSVSTPVRRFNPVWTILYTIWFTLLVAFGTTQAVLLDQLVFGDHSHREKHHRALNAIIWTFIVIWYSSTLIVGGLVLYVHKSMQRARIDDICTKLLLRVAFPLYVCLILFSLLFTILQVRVVSPNDIFTLFATILGHLVFSSGFQGAISLTLIVCGFSYNASVRTPALEGEERQLPEEWRADERTLQENQPLLRDYD